MGQTRAQRVNAGYDRIWENAARIKASERRDFAAYLRNCTDNQVRGVYEKERAAGRDEETHLAELEAARRGIDL